MHKLKFNLKFFLMLTIVINFTILGYAETPEDAPEYAMYSYYIKSKVYSKYLKVAERVPSKGFSEIHNVRVDDEPKGSDKSSILWRIYPLYERDGNRYVAIANVETGTLLHTDRTGTSYFEQANVEIKKTETLPPKDWINSSTVWRMVVHPVSKDCAFISQCSGDEEAELALTATEIEISDPDNHSFSHMNRKIKSFKVDVRIPPNPELYTDNQLWKIEEQDQWVGPGPFTPETPEKPTMTACNCGPHDPPPELIYLTERAWIPYFMVKDPRYPTYIHSKQIRERPYYIMERYDIWYRIWCQINPTDGVGNSSSTEEYTTGCSIEKAKTFSETTGISFTGGVDYKYNDIEFKYKINISHQLGFSETDTFKQWNEERKSKTVSKEIPKKHAMAYYRYRYKFLLKDAKGKIVGDHLEVGDEQIECYVDHECK